MATIPDSLIDTHIALKDQFFDLRGLAVYSALGVGTLRDHIRSGSLPALKVGGKILVKRSEFDKWAEQFRINKQQEINELVDEMMKDLQS